jgi:hypothetical protein
MLSVKQNRLLVKPRVVCQKTSNRSGGIRRVVINKKNKFILWQKSRKREDWIEYKNKFID